MTAAPQQTRQATLGQLLARVCRLAGRRRQLRLERIGLHHAQGMILFHLWHEDGMAQHALSAALHVTPATASNTLRRMERDGWIERRRDKKDRRLVRVYLTERARELHEEAHSSLREFDREMASALSSAEQETLRASLLKIQGYLETVTAEEAAR